MKGIKITYEFDPSNKGDMHDHSLVANCFPIANAIKQFLDAMNQVRHISGTGKPFDAIKTEAICDRLAGKTENFKMVREDKDAEWALEQFTNALEANGLSVDIFDEN